MAIEESFGRAELKGFHTIDNFRLSDLEANAAALNLTPAQCVEVITVVDEIDEIFEDASRGIDVVEDMIDNLNAQEDIVYSVDTLKDSVSEAEDLFDTFVEKDKKFIDLLPPSAIKSEGLGDDMVEHLGQLWVDIMHNRNVVRMNHIRLQNWWIKHTDDILVLLTHTDR